MPFVVTANQLGQSLFAPPNVKGWPGGEAWINSTTLARAQGVPRAPVPGRGAARDAGGEMAGGMEQPLAAARLAPGQERYLRAMLQVQFDSGAVACPGERRRAGRGAAGPARGGAGGAGRAGDAGHGPDTAADAGCGVPTQVMSDK